MQVIQAPNHGTRLISWMESNLQEVKDSLAASGMIHCQDGDLSIIDNMRWMHGRAPFTGTRKVLAAMGYPQDVPAQTTLFQ